MHITNKGPLEFTSPSSAVTHFLLGLVRLFTSKHHSI
jgi:hypothetical protein